MQHIAVYRKHYSSISAVIQYRTFYLPDPILNLFQNLCSVKKMFLLLGERGGAHAFHFCIQYMLCEL